MYYGVSVEHRVMSWLLKEEREVYVPLVDDSGVDLIVRSREGAAHEFQELQIKSLREGGLFAAISCPNPRPNYWFVFYSGVQGLFWLINSMTFVTIASRNSDTCKNAGKYSLSLTVKGGNARPATAEYLITDFSQLP